MARDPDLQRFAGSTAPGLEDGQSGSGHPMRAGRIFVPWQHPNLVLHFVCELRESSFMSRPSKLDPDFRQGDERWQMCGYFPPPCGEGCLSEAKTGWGLCEGCTPPLPLPTRGRGILLFLLTTFLIESSHSSPCSVKEALSGCRFLSVEKGRCL